MACQIELDSHPCLPQDEEDEVGSSLPDNKLVKLHEFLFIVAWKTFGECGFLLQ